jgi:hypothetical protein
LIDPIGWLKSPQKPLFTALNRTDMNNPLRPLSEVQPGHTSKAALNLLGNLEMEYKIRKYPETPVRYLVKTKFTDKTANGLTKCITSFLSLNGWQAERINCTGRPIDNRRLVTDCIGNSRMIGSIDYIQTTGTRGTADISATIAGRSVKIEVKIGSDRQSDYQRQYQKSVEAAGGVYVIARDFGQFLTWYENFMKRRVV